MESRQCHAVVLFDIDNTLVDYNKSLVNVHWVVSRDFWYNQMRDFKLEQAKKNIIVHYGIATLKPLYQSDNHRENNMKGDFISRTVINNSTDGLQDLIDPQLVFYLGTEFNHAKNFEDQSTCKSRYALIPAWKHIQTKFPGSINQRNIILIDDQPAICQAANEHFSAICVENLVDASIDDQRNQIKDIFKQIATIQQTYSVKEEKTHEPPDVISSTEAIIKLLKITPKSFTAMTSKADETKPTNDENPENSEHNETTELIAKPAYRPSFTSHQGR